MKGVVVSYSGVHQAYQLALAAEEGSCLERFLCSWFDGPGLWGGVLGLVLGREGVRRRGLAGIPREKVREFPWPELGFKLGERLLGLPGRGWMDAARRFDGWAAGRVRELAAGVLVCSENCARESFRVAAGLGWRRVYDCPGCNAEWLQGLTEEAGRWWGVEGVWAGDSAVVKGRKEEELGLAEVVLAYSEFHAAGLVARGVRREQIVTVPLWCDGGFWRPREWGGAGRDGLRVIFAGGISVRKGVPFLVEAVRGLGPRVRLSLVGAVEPGLRGWLGRAEGFTRVLGPVCRERLRELYQEHDVLVLPSLGDSFGFVALEAMACGLPVVVTTHCGVPVPDEGWRVPVMDVRAIRERLEFYLDGREELAVDGRRAREFAVGFTAERYRKGVGEVMKG